MNAAQNEFRAYFSVALRMTARFSLVQRPLTSFLAKLEVTDESCPLKISAFALLAFCRNPAAEPDAACLYGILTYLEDVCVARLPPEEISLKFVQAIPGTLKDYFALVEDCYALNSP